MPIRGKSTGVPKGARRRALIKARTRIFTHGTNKRSNDVYICHIMAQCGGDKLESAVWCQMNARGISDGGWGFNIHTRHKATRYKHVAARHVADAYLDGSEAKANRRRRKFLNELLRLL